MEQEKIRGITPLSNGRYRVLVELDRKFNPNTGKLMRQRVWKTVGSWKAAVKLHRSMHSAKEAGTFVQQVPTTVYELVHAHVENFVKPLRRAETVRVYESLIKKHLSLSELGGRQVQKIRASDLESFFWSLKLAPGSVTILRAVMSHALKRATRDKVIASNPAADVDMTLRPSQQAAVVREMKVWTQDEARRFLQAAEAHSLQAHLFYALSLTIGARRNELLGLRWQDVDLEAGIVTIGSQLLSTTAKGRKDGPKHGPTKTSDTRVFKLRGSPQLLALFAKHRSEQAALRLRSGERYKNFGLVFAREPMDLTVSDLQLGGAMQGVYDRRVFRQLIKAAGVPPIRFHDLRHTTASLRLSDGDTLPEVAKLLGHRNARTTLGTYLHVLPGRQEESAAKHARLLFG